MITASSLRSSSKSGTSSPGASRSRQNVGTMSMPRSARSRRVSLLHVPARDLAAVLEPHAAVLDLLEHAQELLRVMLVVPGRADDDELVSPPVDARPVPGHGLDLPAALRERLDGEIRRR